MNPLETYLKDLLAIRSSGAAVKETSGYGPLASLFNTIGQTLKPKVRCLIGLRNQGAGMPDAGFFTPEQFPKPSDAEPLGGQSPARGVIEVKPASDDAWLTSEGEQVSRYWGHYRLVLVTNYRDFVLVGRDANGKPAKLETFRLAPGEAAFWSAAATPRKTADALGERFTEYLKRVMLHAAPLQSPQDVAWFLASYARDARARVEAVADLPALTAVRTALEEALGMKFEQQKGEHFFRSTLVQTLFYGVFSAWVLWHKQNPMRRDRFDWHAAAWTLHVPMIGALFEQIATRNKLGPLGLVEPLDWTTTALNRVDRAEFFARFVESHAVQYFYEPFLEAFDPALRKELSVWYTPPEIVEYQVARVDTVLREELGLADGLASDQVYVLDPCCGTGAYLVEVLRRMTRTIREEKRHGTASLVKAKEAAMHRVYGFELMPAPFVVAHLQMGLLLQSLGVPLDDAKGERAGIFLTNSLTGWEFSGENPHLRDWPELEAERKGAGIVKSKTPILVILGNPPYNAYAGTSPEEEQGLVDPYKDGLVTKWGIKKFNLDDLYVRFLRIAERKIAEQTGQGIVSFISNFSYLADPSFVVMRQRFLKEFDLLWFDCLNGDSRETGKLTPEGKPDPSVFSTEHNREGIRVGTAVCVMVRRPKRGNAPKVLYREFWGVTKRADLVASLKVRKSGQKYKAVEPAEENRFSFQPSKVGRKYLKWPKLVELCAEPPSNGLMEKRGGALIDTDEKRLRQRMVIYYDPAVSWEQLKALGTGLTEDAAGFDAKKVRVKVQAAENFSPNHLRRYALRPFDTRWCYYSDVSPLWNRSRSILWAQCWEGNAFLMSRPGGVASPEGVPLFYTPLLGDNDFLRGHAYYFSFRLRAASPKKKDDGNGEFGSVLQEAAAAYHAGGGKTTANLSPPARAYLAKLGIKNPDADAETAALLWLHALAIGYAPAYLAENADGIRQDWPRVPLPDAKATLLASAELGRQVAALLDTEAPVPGVPSGTLRPELGCVAELQSAGAPDLHVTAGWGHAGKDGVTMPGKGKLVTRGFMPEEVAAMGLWSAPAERSGDGALASSGAATAPFCSAPSQSGVALRLPPQPIFGQSTQDVFLNDTTCWRNVPERVWDFTIGGYQVLKKWLSYREHALLGRALTADEACEATNTARRLAALLLLQPALDANYQRVRDAAYSWTA